MSLSNFLNGHFIFMHVSIGMLIVCVVSFGIKYYHTRRELEECAELIRENYTQREIDVPALILRIESECTNDYNKLAGHWMGVLFRIRRYSATRENRKYFNVNLIEREIVWIRKSSQQRSHAG